VLKPGEWLKQPEKLARAIRKYLKRPSKNRSILEFCEPSTKRPCGKAAAARIM
jgi:hypothetical protein